MIKRHSPCHYPVLRAVPLLVFLWGAGIQASDTPTLTASLTEIRHQSIKKKTEPFFGVVIGGSEVARTKLTLTVAMASPGLNPADFTAATEFSVNLLDSESGNMFEVVVALGDNRKYKPGMTTVKIRNHAGERTHVKLTFTDGTATLAYKGSKFFISPLYLNKSSSGGNHQPAGAGTATGSTTLTATFAGTNLVASLPYHVTFKNTLSSIGFFVSDKLWHGKAKVDASIVP